MHHLRRERERCVLLACIRREARNAEKLTGLFSYEQRRTNGAGEDGAMTVKQLQRARLSARARQFRILAQRLRFHIDSGTLVPGAIDALKTAETALTDAAASVDAQAEDTPGPGRNGQ
jgi:hypothetical protein